MTNTRTPRITICGILELGEHSAAGVTHVLSILDPEFPEPPAFAAYDPHHRLTLRFHDIIGRWPGWRAPRRPNALPPLTSAGRSCSSS